jgi:glutamine amidotransferase
MIMIADYGMGNLGSIQNMFRRIGVDSEIVSDSLRLASAKKIILPGVGAFDHAMERINNSGLREVLDHKALKEKIPVLGICLGMQLLTRSSEEGKLAGLSWINASTTRFPSLPNLKIPHMGWNLVTPATPSLLTKDLPQDSRFYFVHSYKVMVDDSKNSILRAHYGVGFDAAIQSDNIYGAQFHPEKSHKFGMKFFENFARL